MVLTLLQMVIIGLFYFTFIVMIVGLILWYMKKLPKHFKYVFLAMIAIFLIAFLLFDPKAIIEKPQIVIFSILAFIVVFSKKRLPIKVKKVKRTKNDLIGLLIIISMALTMLTLFTWLLVTNL